MSSSANSGAAALITQKAVTTRVACLSVPVRRIVTFHMNGLGDLLFTLPALDALRESFPGAVITSVVPSAFMSLMRDSPLVDALLPRPKSNVSDQARLMRNLHDQHFDIALGFSGTRKTALCLWATGADMRVGYANAKLAQLLTRQVKIEGPPRIETHLELVNAVGGHPHHSDYKGLLAISSQNFQRADKLLTDSDVKSTFAVVACAASGKRTIKEWMPEYWQQTIVQLATKMPVVLVGAERSEAILSGLPTDLPVYDFGGQTDLPVLAALCGRARVFVGIDSGVLHLSACMGTPVVGIYGPSDWRLTGPRGVPYRIARHEIECSPCLLAKCKWQRDMERACLTRLKPEQVLKAIDEVLLESNAPACS
ncbi:MAG: glycosyltransferase family 9 protein [Abditibacteriaceae bacterium]